MELRCSKCGQIKPAEQFCKDGRRPSGRSSHCRECHRAYYQKRPTAKPLKPGDTKRCTKCGQVRPVKDFDKSDRYRTGYTSTCKACRRATSRAWKRRNKKQVQEYQAQWREEHPDYNREWREALPDETKERYLEHRRAYYKTPHGRITNLHAYYRRRAAKRKGDVTPEWLERLYDTQTHCAYCGREFDDDVPPTIEHVFPLSKGGTHTRDNIVLACKSCNLTKSDRIIDNVCISPEFESRTLESLEGLL